LLCNYKTSLKMLYICFLLKDYITWIFFPPRIFLKTVGQKMNMGTVKPKREPEKVNVRMWLLHISAIILCIVRECIFTKITLKLLNSSTAVLKRSKNTQCRCQKSLLNILFHYCTPVILKVVCFYVGVQIPYTGMCCFIP